MAGVALRGTVARAQILFHKAVINMRRKMRHTDTLSDVTRQLDRWGRTIGRPMWHKYARSESPVSRGDMVSCEDRTVLRSLCDRQPLSELLCDRQPIANQ